MLRNYMPHVALLTAVLFFGALFWLDSPPAYTQVDPANITQLTNFHSGPVSSGPGGFTELNGAVYFGLTSEKGGLWKSDGTEQGTVLVKDIKVDVYSLQRVGDLLYFTAYDEYFNRALWKSDGSAAGTVVVKENLAVQSKFVAIGDTIFFGAYEPVYGTELWKSDGTSEGTELVADLAAGAEGIFPQDLTALNGKLYFTGYDFGLFSNVLFQSDGTSEGTAKQMGAPQSPYSLRGAQDTLYFIAYDEQHGEELWRFGPGNAQPTLVVDINPGTDSANIGQMTVHNGRLFFRAENGVNGQELWQSDGTATNTKMVADIESGIDGSNPFSLTSLNDLLYFSASTANLGVELWKSDGTATGTVLVSDILPGPASSEPIELTTMAGELYFLARNDQFASDLWKSDGTAAGTIRLYENLNSSFSFGASLLYAADGTLYFSNYDESHGAELWRSDGTPAGTQFVKDLDFNHWGAVIDQFVRVKNRLYYILYSNKPASVGQPQLWMRVGTDSEAMFVQQLLYIEQMRSVENDLYIAGTDATGSALWKHDGSTGALELMRRFEASLPANLTPLGNQLFFIASDEFSSDPENSGVPIYDIWRTDGTADGTVRLTQGVPALFGGAASAVFAGSFFVAGGNEIWVTDGTPAGTRHFAPVGLAEGVSQFISASNSLYFTGSQDVWQTNGVLEGTHKLSHTEELPFLSNRVAVGNSFYVITYSEENKTQLWYSDGVSKNLVQLTDVEAPPRNFGNYYNLLQPVGEQLFFTVNSAATGVEIWKSNGEPEGTTLVKDIAPPELGKVAWSYPSPLFEFGNLLFFGAHDGVHGKELWQSDGSADGTFMVKDIYPGILSSAPEQFVSKGNIFFFTAIDAAHGRELWQSDGTTTGTQLVTDLYPGFASSQPFSQLIFDNTLYFTADNGLDGRQLFGLVDPGIPLALPVEQEPPAAFPHQFYMPLINR